MAVANSLAVGLRRLASSTKNLVKAADAGFMLLPGGLLWGRGARSGLLLPGEVYSGRGARSGLLSPRGLFWGGETRAGTNVLGGGFIARPVL